jgi:hypothetical protein
MKREDDALSLLREELGAKAAEIKSLQVQYFKETVSQNGS